MTQTPDGLKGLEALPGRLKTLLARQADAVSRREWHHLPDLAGEMRELEREARELWESGPDLPPGGKEPLYRALAETAAVLEENLHHLEKEKRLTLTKLLSCLAARDALDCYRRPPARNHLNRTV